MTTPLMQDNSSRTGLMALNALFLVLYSVGWYESYVKESQHLGAGNLLAIVFLVAPLLLGLLAATNPCGEKKRKIAKWSNLAVGTFQVFALFIIPSLVVRIVLGIAALPLLLNVLAFWKRQNRNKKLSDTAPPPAVNLGANAQLPIIGSSAVNSRNVEDGLPIEGKRAESQDNPDQPPHWKNDQRLDGAAPAPSTQRIEDPVAIKKDVRSVATVRRANYFVRHWRGELSLGISYWVNGLLVGLIVLLAANGVAATRDMSLRLWAALPLVVYATAIVASTWQFVGVWRSASNHVARGGQAGWATMAKVIVALGVVNSCGLIWRTYIPQSLELVNIIAGDSRFPAYKISVLPGGTEVEFRGGLRAGCAKELERILMAVPQAKVLHIESPGGRIGEAERMIQLVRERGLTTYTSEQCLSAATLVLLSGKERVIAADAKVGFHAGSLPGATDEQQRGMDSLVRSIMQSAGISDKFITRVLATPPDQMWYPVFDEMLEARVVTSRSFGDRFATSLDVSHATIQKMGTLPGASTIREFEPEAWTKMTADFATAIRAGKSEADAAAVAAGDAAGLMPKYLPAASDEALLAVRDQWIALLGKYKNKNSQACIAAFTDGRVSISRAFPEFDTTNTLQVLDKVMRSGSTRIPLPLDKKAAEDDLGTVFPPIAERYGNDLLLLQHEDQWMDNSQKVCDMLLRLYQNVAALPDKRSANLVRYLVSASAQSEEQPLNRLATQTPESYVNLAFQRYGEGRYGEAVEACRLALGMRHDYAEAWNNLGAAYYALGRHVEATDAFENALHYKPSFESAQKNLQNVRGRAKAVAK